jgi:hypothetical protein
VKSLRVIEFISLNTLVETLGVANVLANAFTLYTNVGLQQETEFDMGVTLFRILIPVTPDLE